MHTLSRFAAATAGVFVFACLAPAQVRNWAQTGSGTYSWTDATCWSGGIPDGNNAVAVFSGAGAGAAKTATVAGTITLEQLQVNATQSSPLAVTGGVILLRNVGGGGAHTPITVGSYAAPVTHTITSILDFDGSSGTRTISVGANATLDLGGQFVNSANGTFEVAGGGTTVLSGNNAGVSTPITTSGAGTTLAVTGTIGSPVTVGSGTTLTGTGTINGGVTVNDGGTLTGNLNVGTLALDAGAVNYTANVGGTPASPVNDMVTINGALTAQAGTVLNFTLVDDGTLVPGGTYTVTLLDATSISGLTGTQITATAANFGFAGTPLTTVDNTLGTVNLTFTVVPEPATALGVGAIGLGALWLRRRRAVRA